MTTPTTPARPFRFGVVTPVLTDMATWRDRVRHIADSGFSTLLVPDVPGWQPAPEATLATAAAITDLRVGTWVYASPVRTAFHTAWEAHSLTQLTEGRFELGIGAGRPGIEDDLPGWGVPTLTPDERWERVRDAVTKLRELDGADVRTPVVVAARSAKGLALAGEIADTVNIAQLPKDTRADIARIAHDLQQERDIEIAWHIPVVGDAVSPFMAPPDTDTAALHAADSLMALPSDARAAVEELLRRRNETGASYVVVGSNNVDVIAPVVAELAGR